VPEALEERVDAALVQPALHDRIDLQRLEACLDGGVDALEHALGRAPAPAHAAEGRLVERIKERWAIRPIEASYRGEVAERWEFEDGAGEIGFISSVTQPFCGDCTRARLSSDGGLYTCLFAARGTDLRGPMRAGIDDAELGQMIDRVWTSRGDRYSEQRADSGHEVRVEKIEMYYIGG
jgi:cyclic pyranopterin phosphate synthase